MTDDMGWADIGSYGAQDIRTPNIDSLARDGVKLTDFYSNGVLCTPTRAGLMSGRYQQRYGLEIALPNEGAPGAERGLPATGRSLRTHTFVFNVRTDISERQDLASRRQDTAQKMQLLLADWERDVDAEAKRTQPATASAH
jgi:hypothetical protein